MVKIPYDTQIRRIKRGKSHNGNKDWGVLPVENPSGEDQTISIAFRILFDFTLHLDSFSSLVF